MNAGNIDSPLIPGEEKQGIAKKVLFIDRDGTIIKEAPPTYQIDSYDKLQFYPGMFTWLSRIATELDYELVMPTNQD